MTVAVDATAFMGSYPEGDAFLGEKVQPDEKEAARGLIQTLARKVQAEYAEGSAKRDAHPKAHGCVEAVLEIRPDLPGYLVGGVFQRGARYRAIVRFSNGSPNAGRPDISGDTRGMAIKLFGVEGDKIFPDPANPDAQDFVMISWPSFFINNAKHYTRFFEAVNTGSLLKLAMVPRYLGLAGGVHAAKMMMQKIANPLETRYWSVVPYQLGTGEARQAVKFSARPMGEASSKIPDNPAPDFLRKAMARTLAEGPFGMEFLIQRGGAAGLDVEDAVTEWPEGKAPFERAGVLTILQQAFDTPERDAYGETQSFNPWHCLHEHKPLGMISRTRRVVYEAIAELRHRMNGTTYPVGLPQDKEGM